MRSAFDTLLGKLYDVVEKTYESGTDLWSVFITIQKLQGDILTMHNADELNHREYTALYSLSSIIRENIKNKLKGI